MSSTTLSRTVAYSLGAHGMALVMIFMVNANAPLPGQTLETVPFIKASLVYAMAAANDEMTASRLHQKMKQETRTASRPVETGPSVEPLVRSTDGKPEPTTAIAEIEKTRQVEKMNWDSSTALHLPNLSGVRETASHDTSSRNHHDGRGHRESFREEAKTSALPRYLSTSRPAYPMIARMRGYQGVVLISVEVLADGRAGQIRINRSSGHASLDKSAMEAVRGWRFEPARKSGMSVATWVEIPIRFSLNDDA